MNQMTNIDNFTDVLNQPQAQEGSELLNRIMERDANGYPVNEDAWSEFYNKYNKIVLSMANKILHNSDDAQDIVHDIFLKCIKEFDNYDKGKPFKNWFCTIVKNHCISELKKRNSRPVIYIGSIYSQYHEHESDEENKVYCSLVDSVAQTPYEKAILLERNNEIYKALFKLKPEFREIVELKYFENMSYEQIAAKIGKPLGTVMSRLFYARKGLRKLLGHLFTTNKNRRKYKRKQEKT